MIELYSIFYISQCCQDQPTPIVQSEQPSTSHIPSPMSSPGGSEELVEENHRLIVQLQ